MVQLATPTFLSGPQDDLASVDIYEQKSVQVINSIQELQADRELALYDSLRGGAAGALDSHSVLQSFDASGQLMVNKDNLITRLSAASSSVLAGIRNISNQVAGAINKAIPGQAPLLAKIGTIVQRVQSTNLHSLASIGSTISSLTGNPTLFSLQDHGAQIGLYSGLIQEASRLGIPNSFGELMAAVENPNILRQVAMRALPSIVGTSDIHSLVAMASQLSQGSVKHMLPQVVQQFASNYRRTTIVPVGQKKQDWQQIEGAFNDIDPQWNTCRRDFMDGSTQEELTEEIVAIHNLSSASQELREASTMAALTSEDPDKQLMVLANVYPPVSVDDSLGSEFPQTDLGWHRRVVTNPVDPITASAISSPKEQNRPTSLYEWAIQQPGVTQTGMGRELKIYAGGRLLYDGETDDDKPAPISISGEMNPSPAQQLRPETLENWALRQPGAVHAGFGVDHQVYANGVKLYDGATDMGKMAPVNASVTNGKPKLDFANDPRFKITQSSVMHIDPGRDGFKNVDTKYWVDPSQGRDYGPSSMFTHDTLHDDEAEPEVRRNPAVREIANRNDW